VELRANSGAIRSAFRRHSISVPARSITWVSPPVPEGTIFTGITGDQVQGTSVQSGLPLFLESSRLE
jgi:hypothetical protein